MGWCHDLMLLGDSGWDKTLDKCIIIGGRQFYIYGECAYLLSPWMQRPFVSGFSSQSEQIFNTAMRSVRVSVEHRYMN